MVSKVLGRSVERNRRPDVEEFLLAHHVAFTYREDQTTEGIDRALSMANQVRVGGKPVDQKVIERYTENILDGDIFPPIWVYRHQGGNLVILDGNHRYLAHVAAGVGIDYYLCEAPVNVLVMISFLGNAKHGVPNSPEDRLHHALFLVDSGISQSEAARQLGCVRKDLAAAVARRKAQRRADAAGVRRPIWDSLPASSRNRLGTIHTEEGFKAAFDLVADAGLLAGDVAALVGELNGTRSATRQLEIVKSWRLRFDDQIRRVHTSGPENVRGKPKGRNPRAGLASAVGFVLSLPPKNVYEIELSSETLPDSMRVELLKNVNAAMARLGELREVLL